MDGPLQKFGRLGDARDPFRRSRHFEDRLHGQSELVLAEPKHQELLLLGRLVKLWLRSRCAADFVKPFHDVLPKEPFRRKDRDQSPALLATIDRFDASLASRTRLNHGWHVIDQRWVGRDDGAGTIGEGANK